MMIKKPFAALHSYITKLLQENESISLAESLESLMPFMSVKPQKGMKPYTSILDINGNTVAMFDSFMKVWLPLVGPQAYEFGLRSKSANKLNYTSRLGQRLLARRIREKFIAERDLLNRISAGEISGDEIAKEREKIKQARFKPYEGTEGFKTKEEVIAYLLANQVSLPVSN